MKYAIFSDVDGTIYSHTQTYHEDTKKQIQAAQAKGIEFIMCTGNPYFSKMRDMSIDLNVDYFVGSNGAFIYDVKNKKELFLNHISKEQAQEILNMANEMGLGANWWDADNLYGNKHILPEIKEKLKRVMLVKEKLVSTDVVKADIQKIETYAEDTPEGKKKTDELEAKLSGMGLQVARIRPFHIEITKQNVSKGEAVIALSKHLGIELDNVMTIGDSGNDHSMFAVTDYSYAMGNAPDYTKSLANYQTSTVNQNGLGEAILDFMFRKRLTSNFDNQK